MANSRRSDSCALVRLVVECLCVEVEQVPFSERVMMLPFEILMMMRYLFWQEAWEPVLKALMVELERLEPLYV